MAYIEFQNIEKYYGENHVLKDISLSVEKGSFVTLLGPSGCGKSTLLRCLSGLEAITSGQIILDGENITEKEPKNRNIGMVFQQYSLFPNLTVEENIAFGLKLKKMGRDEIARNVQEAVQMVELAGKENQYPSNLSGGQQQRVALARSIVMRPKVLLLDEPLSAIDAKLRKSLQARIREIQSTLGLTTIFVTHDQDEAMVMSDVIHLFHDGVIEQSGSPISMYTGPKTTFAASFIGNYNIFTPEEFSYLIREDCAQQGKLAVRPETVEIAVAGPDVRTVLPRKEDAYTFFATVTESMPRGNVLRYTLEAGGQRIKADVLFRSFKLFEPGTRLMVTIEKRNCLQLEDSAEICVPEQKERGELENVV